VWSGGQKLLLLSSGFYILNLKHEHLKKASKIVYFEENNKVCLVVKDVILKKRGLFWEHNGIFFFGTFCYLKVTKTWFNADLI